MAPFQKYSFSSDSYFESKHPEDQLAQVVVRATRSNQEGSRSNDPFLYYSNDENRMRKLKMLTYCSSEEDARKTEEGEEGEGEGEPSLRHPQEAFQPSNKNIRKTRISFELHPDLILEDVLEDISCAGDDDTSLDGGDTKENETWMKKPEKMTKSELLFRLLLDV